MVSVEWIGMVPVMHGIENLIEIMIDSRLVLELVMKKPAVRKVFHQRVGPEADPVKHQPDKRVRRETRHYEKHHPVNSIEDCRSIEALARFSRLYSLVHEQGRLARISANSWMRNRSKNSVNVRTHRPALSRTPNKTTIAFCLNT